MIGSFNQRQENLMKQTHDVTGVLPATSPLPAGGGGPVVPPPIAPDERVWKTYSAPAPIAERVESLRHPSLRVSLAVRASRRAANRRARASRKANRR